MNKKILISSLLLGSAISILPFNFISNNASEETINETVEETEIISDSLNTREAANGEVFQDRSYTTVYINNLTRPVVSPNSDVSGFLGAWTTNTVDVFPNAIGWTSPGLFQSWSVFLKDHPSLQGNQVPDNFTPALVTALYSDNTYSTNKRNQIFAIVGNASNLASKEYWILRYNAIDGSPIRDDNAKMPTMNNAPVPEMSFSSGNGSAFALTNDALNDRYIAFYPGRLGDLKNDIFGFELTNENKINWLNNNTHFSGHSNWAGSTSSSANFDFLDDNFVLGLAPHNTRRSNNGSGISLMYAVGSNVVPNSYEFRILDLGDNFSAINSFVSKRLIGRTAGVFNNTQDTIGVPRNLISLSTIQKHINPHLQLFNFVNPSGQNTHKVQMVVPILRGSEWIFMYLSGVFDNGSNSYLNTWGAGSLSQGSFFSSPLSTSMPPNISYNEVNPNEIILTSQTQASNILSFSANQFKFDFLPNSGPWDPEKLLIGTQEVAHININWKPKNIAFKLPYDQNFITWSLQGGKTALYSTLKNTPRLILSLLNGGVRHESFQNTASAKGWLDGQHNSKSPSEITDFELGGVSQDPDSFFRIPAYSGTGFNTHVLEAEVDGEASRDDSTGIIKGNLNLVQRISHTFFGEHIFETKIPFKVTGLNIKNDVPTSINQNSSILNNLPSELTVDNVSNFIDIIAAPIGHGEVEVKNWDITNQDNVSGTATVSVDIKPHYNSNGVLTDSFATLSTNVSGLRTVSGTTASAILSDVSNLTVWDINNSDAENFIQLNDLIPGSPTNNITYSIRDEAPLIGELTIVASVPAGSYYDPANKGLPSVVGGSRLELPVRITGFKTIPDTGTLVIPRNGPHNGIFPEFIKENNLADFFDIVNAVPGSTYEIDNINYNRGNVDVDFSGKISFELTFNRQYETNGHITESPAKRTITIEGFEPGIPPNNTLVLLTRNRELYSNTLAPEINENNIERYIVLVNLPTNVDIRYEFGRQVNTGNPNTGLQNVKVIFSRYLDTAGDPVEEELEFDITIDGLKTIEDETSIQISQGSDQVLPQHINEIEISNYYTIVNPSPILNRPTSIEIKRDSIVRDNINGRITLQYQLINAVTDFGFIERSDDLTLVINGFQKGSVTRVETIGNFNDKKASEFELTMDNFSNHIRLAGYIIQDIDEEGNFVGTKITKIEKISFDDDNATATFKVTIVGGAINQQELFTNDEVEITFVIEGFEKITPQDNTIWIIVGAISGGIALIILVIISIMLYNNSKNKKILNQKRKPTSTSSAPPSNSGGTRPVSPPGTMRSSTTPASPGVTRPIPPTK